MKGPLSTLIACLVIVLAAIGYGLFERHVGAQQALARQRADSLLQASKMAQDSIQRADSIRGVAYRSRLDSISRVLGASRALYARSRSHSDSLISATRSDSTVPRDTVAAMVGAFQQERAAADSQIATLTTENTLLRGEISAKDSTIRALNTLLDGNRAQLREALKPQSPGLLERAGRVAELVLAVRGGIAFAVGR